jgi:hypothetical protein
LIAELIFPDSGADADELVANIWLADNVSKTPTRRADADDFVANTWSADNVANEA